MPSPDRQVANNQILQTMYLVFDLNDIYMFILKYFGTRWSRLRSVDRRSGGWCSGEEMPHQPICDDHYLHLILTLVSRLLNSTFLFYDGWYEMGKIKNFWVLSSIHIHWHFIDMIILNDTSFNGKRLVLHFPWVVTTLKVYPAQQRKSSSLYSCYECDQPTQRTWQLDRSLDTASGETTVCVELCRGGVLRINIPKHVPGQQFLLTDLYA